MQHSIDIRFYPGWTRKAITFSIDDGNVPMDEKFINILRPAGIHGTFNLCSHNLGYLTPEQYREFYKGDEIANHCKYHPFAFVDGKEYQISEEAFDEASADPELLYRTDTEQLYRVHKVNGWRNITDADGYCAFIDAGKQELEEVFGKGSVRSYVWPFQQQECQKVLDHLKLRFEQGVYYGVRKSGEKGAEEGFPLPVCRLPWHYTATHANLLEYAERYEAQPDDGELKFFCIGVHSIDYERAGKWDVLQAFADRYGHRPQDYFYAPVGEIFDYADALDRIEITEHTVKNPTDRDLYIRVDDRNVVLKAGMEYILGGNGND